MINAHDLVYPLIDSEEQIFHWGLNKREYFAAMALQGILSNYYGKNLNHERLTADSVIYADALINELNKQP